MAVLIVVTCDQCARATDPQPTEAAALVAFARDGGETLRTRQVCGYCLGS